MARPTLHLICNAHLDPVWQWRWDEGCGEALSTFGTAIRMIDAHPDLIFNHNEAILYQWVRRYDPALFRAIQKHVRAGRWHISGGWYLQPDVNMPLIESIIRHITEGRRFFAEHFDAHPTVAYNFDSFGHGGGLPQVLKQAGYRMYIHMRPQEAERHMPSDLYRWQGVDGSEILTYRIAVGLYHTERDNIEQRLQEGTELALRLGREVPVFWGIGNHGGGATREDLERIDAFIGKERRVRILHSTPERLYAAMKPYARTAPVVQGDIQRVFTGCYTSLSRLKRRALTTSSALIQTEALATATWWAARSPYPAAAIDRAWEQTLFNDFHDILPGSCTQPAEQDALDLYGAAATGISAVRMGTTAAFNKGPYHPAYIPVTVLNTNTVLTRVPVEVECMLDLRPKWTGTWHLRLALPDGTQVPMQEEQPESLLPFNQWRRKISFMAELPQLGAARYAIEIHEGAPSVTAATPCVPHTTDPSTGLLTALDAGDGREVLAGPLMQPLVVEDNGDAWGADVWNYRNVLGTFTPTEKKPVVLHDGPVRRTTESYLSHGASTAVVRTTVYPDWPVIEYTCRVHWHEAHKRLKLSFPTVFRSSHLLCEVPGGIITRPADGEEHVHGRWCMLSGDINGKDTALGIVSCGQHGVDVRDGEVRLSVLRSAAYCHEKSLPIPDPPARRYMDQGEHEFRVLVIAGDTATVRAQLPALADWLAAPPAVYAHLPFGSPAHKTKTNATLPPATGILEIGSPAIRLQTFKQTVDGKALLLRLQETLGSATRTTLKINGIKRPFTLSFAPLEIKTLRITRKGSCTPAAMLEER